MKTFLTTIAIGVALLASTSCADLGLGVDVDSGSYSSPYWYPNGYLGDYYWNTPVWNYGPIYNQIPSAPPLLGNGPGSASIPASRPQQATRPPQTTKPPQNNTPTVSPAGPNGIGWNPGPINRPGNNGLPTGKPLN